MILSTDLAMAQERASRNPYDPRWTQALADMHLADSLARLAVVFEATSAELNKEPDE